jgi:alpha-1,3-glucosyltransferase
MRASLILIELLILLPALLKLLVVLYPRQSTTTRRLYLLSWLLMPSVIYVDHGHFQPNSVMHGLVLWAVYFMFQRRESLSIVCMVLAVNFKQMALYYAIPFAAMAIGVIWKEVGIRYKGKGNFIVG